LPKVHYTLFVDESGDQDLEKFRTEERQFGSDPFLVFGAALVPNMYLDEYRRVLGELRNELSVNLLHCTEMSHLKRCYFARRVSKLRVLLFGVVSKKATVGEYREEISGDMEKQDFYNKCAGYLLERVAHFMQEEDIGSDQMSVVFEEKKHNYQRLRSYIKAIGKTPFDERANPMSRLDPLCIRAEGKKDEVLLALADLTSFAIYQSVTETKSNFMTPEQRYLRELKDKFWKNPVTGQIANHGLKFIKGPKEMELKGETFKFVMKFYRKKATNRAESRP
jgi:hypothetical protein